MKNLGGISTPLPNNFITRYRFYLDQDGLARPGVPLIEGSIENEEITMEGREFVVQLLLTMLKTAKTVVWLSPQNC